MSGLPEPNPSNDPLREAALEMVYAMEASIYSAPTIEDDGPYVPKWKQELMHGYRSQEIRALVELKRAVGL